MASRMAALLLLRRQAASGAVPRLQQPYAGLATAAARHDALDAGDGDGQRGGPDEGNKNRWMELPPFAPVDAGAAARAIFRGEGGGEGSSSSTAIRWVRRCCPHLPASLVQRLFRLRKEEEVRDYKSDARKLEELFKKLNPSAEEFVPLSRRQGDSGRWLLADAPVFVSLAIDLYAPHHPFQQQQQQHQQMHMLQVVGGGGGGWRDSSSDGSTNGQLNRRVMEKLGSRVTLSELSVHARTGDLILLETVCRSKVKKNSVTAETSSMDASAEQFRLRRVSAKDHLVPGDTLFLPVNIQESSVAEKTRKFDNRNEIDFLRSLEIYKDKAIIVVNKPPGMPVQGGVGIKNSIDVLAPMFEENSSEAPRLVHRLDRDCSGVLVLGRTQLSASILHAIFREKTADALADGTQQVLQRKYVALVMGTPRHPKGLLSAPLAKVVLQDGKSERLTVRAGPNTTSVQDALTEYRVIESCPQGYTWLELFPLTGRKHQLRVHCAEVLGTPIVGDYKYGRQAHQNWTPLPMPQTIDGELLGKQRLPFGLVLGGGSVTEEQPQLHLHCKQMMLPDISAAIHGMQSEDVDHVFSDLEKLSFVAPLPLHMRLSWEVLKSVNK